MSVRIEGCDIDVGDLRIAPGLVNAHDHLEFSLFPRLGCGPYPNARAWAEDIYHPERSPVCEHLRVPKRLRLLWGGLRNLLSGVTLVSHHNPYDSVFEDSFPVRVVKNYGWAHSFSFTKDIRACADATPPDAPFLIHLAEGTDEESAQEIFELERLGALDSRTVLIHAVGLTAVGWERVAQAEASVVWCPQSNLFSLGKTLDLRSIPGDVRVALGTDSPLTSEGDMLDELRAAEAYCRAEQLQRMVSCTARSILRQPIHDDDWIAVAQPGDPPQLVVVRDMIALISPALARQLPRSLRQQFYPFQIEGRPPVLVRWNVPEWIEETRRCLGAIPLHLGGRRVLA